ncbi:DMT family transporter [Cellulomonas sp. KRMCY2]|uniref:DMT family transporter n=1 Tax=Cellulomonas sp. KRMCY2 TaxID=1304865 RepID=UPI00045E701C|nr:DMT family transporter [Cellulomonas sp. KRMCY2]
MSSTGNVAAARRGTSWIPYAALLVLFWGVWGAFSSQPTSRYGYPDEMVYVIWACTMLIPAYFSMRGRTFDRRGVATKYGLIIGLTGAGGQLLLFKALTMGPAYIIFPIIALSPAITVVMALVSLRERVNRLTAIGVTMALVAIVMFSISSGDSELSTGPYLVLAVLICMAWGVQAYFMRKAATVGVNDATTFGWMTITGILLIPLAIVMMGGLPGGFPWQAPALTAATQVLNAVGALFLVMALSRGKASIVAPVTNALAPVLTIILSLVIYRTLPSAYQTIGIALALAGSTLMVYSDEKRGEELTVGAVADGGRTPRVLPAAEDTVPEVR